jgi:hypothetical protein
MGSLLRITTFMIDESDKESDDVIKQYAGTSYQYIEGLVLAQDIKSKRLSFLMDSYSDSLSKVIDKEPEEIELPKFTEEIEDIDDLISNHEIGNDDESHEEQEEDDVSSIDNEQNDEYDDDDDEDDDIPDESLTELSDEDEEADDEEYESVKPKIIDARKAELFIETNEDENKKELASQIESAVKEVPNNNDSKSQNLVGANKKHLKNKPNNKFNPNRKNNKFDGKKNFNKKQKFNNVNNNRNNNSDLKKPDGFFDNDAMNALFEKIKE